MSYDHGISISHNIGSINVATAGTVSVKGPPGMQGRIRALSGSVKTSLAANGTVKIGNVSDDDRYASLVLANVAAPDGFTTRLGQVTSGPGPLPIVDADEEILLVFGTGTGVFDGTLLVDWF